MIPALEKITGKQVRRGPPEASHLEHQQDRSKSRSGERAGVGEATGPVADRRLLRRASITSARCSAAFRGTPEAVEYYETLRARGERTRIAAGRGSDHPGRPDGPEQKYRLVVEGPPNWTSFREFWRMFSQRAARWSSRARTRRSAASTTSASGTTRRDPLGRRSRTTAAGCYTNLGASRSRVDMLVQVHPRVPGGRRARDQLGEEL